jgi:aspartate racemase
MKKPGIIGGLGPESTKLYYTELINRYLNRSGGQFPEIVIYSLDMSEFKAYLDNNDLDSVIGLLSGAVDSLANAGADFVSIASNTPHIVFDQVNENANVPMISIVRESARYAEKVSMNKKIGLLGTGFTMKADFYPVHFAKYEMEIFVPGNEDQDFIHEKIFSELAVGIVKDSTKKRFIDITESMIAEKAIDSLVLGCTELPLIFNQNYFDINYIDTADIHINSIIEYCLRNT